MTPGTHGIIVFNRHIFLLGFHPQPLALEVPYGTMFRRNVALDIGKIKNRMRGFQYI